MIIDQLTPTSSDNLTDEIPVEQGQLTYKTTWQKVLNLFKGNLSASDIATSNGTVQGDIGDMDLTTTAADLTDAINELDSDKQDTLVSGTNIKTINNTSLLGSGNITIEGGSGGGSLYVRGIVCVVENGDFAEEDIYDVDGEYAIASLQFTEPSAITTDVDWYIAGFTAGVRHGITITLRGKCVRTTSAEAVLVKVDSVIDIDR